MKATIFIIRTTLIYIVYLLCISCETESSKIGTDFFRSSSLDIAFVDSSTINLSTVKFDSLITNNASRILLGSHVDAKLGRLSAYTYFQPSLTDANPLDNTNIYFDHLAIVLKYNGYSYYDTTVVQTLYVHQLDKRMQLPENGQLYNTTDFSAQKPLLGSISFSPKPHRKDSIEIPLDENFGEIFFNKAKQNHSDFKSSDKFAEYIKGFRVHTDTSLSAGIIGFTATPQLRLYYIDKNEVPSKRKFIAYNTDNIYSSTRIKTNRGNTKLKSLPGYRSRLSAALTDNEAYLQAGAGLSLRIDIPYLRELKQLSNFYIVKAVLQIQPVRNSYDKSTRLPASLKIHQVNYRNESIGMYPYDAELYEDLSMGRDSYYEIDATALVEYQMELVEQNENALILLLPDENFRLGVDRVHFANPSHQYNTHLKIYYATILN